MRLESCTHFDAEMFIKLVNKDWKREKKRLQMEREKFSELPAINNETGISSGKVSDLTADMAANLIYIDSEIAEIERCERLYAKCKEKLSPVEKDVLELFFEPKMPIWKAIDRYAEKNFTNRSHVYRLRRLALKSFEKNMAIYL